MQALCPAIKRTEIASATSPGALAMPRSLVLHFPVRPEMTSIFCWLLPGAMALVHD
jgi:hypothetical protein